MTLTQKVLAALGFIGIGILVFPKSAQSVVPDVPEPVPGNKTTSPKTPVVTNPSAAPTIGSNVYFNKKADESAINLFKTLVDYPNKVYMTLPVGKRPRNPIKFLGWQGFIYNNSTVTVTLYQVLIGTMSTPVYVPSYYFSTNPNS